MEELALDYTKRLILSRAKVFLPNGDLSLFFDIKDDDLFELLFEVSMNIPRKVGYILSYCYESNLIHNTKITQAAIGNAAVRYYDEVVRKYFESNQYVLRPFDDRVSIENQKGLMDKIVTKQLSNKQSIYKSNAKLFKNRNKPTSHFVIGDRFTNYVNKRISLTGNSPLLPMAIACVLGSHWGRYPLPYRTS